MTGTNTHVITALNISNPDVSGEIVLSCSAILAAAITSDNVDVNKTRGNRGFQIKPTFD